MIDPFKHVPLHRRVALTIWTLNIVLCLALLVFALR